MLENYPSYSRDRIALVDVLDRILDKGVVIVGDINISLCDVELLTIKLKLLIASVETAEKMGIDFGWAGVKKKKLKEPEKILAPEIKSQGGAKKRRSNRRGYYTT